jgi:putative transposase
MGQNPLFRSRFLFSDSLLEVYRYIELNPVKAKMVDDPSEYVWSSYQINVLGKASELCTPHPEYLKLGNTKAERMKNYRALLFHHVEGDLLEEIRSSTNKGMAIGHDRFKDEIEGLTGRRLKPKKVGRPVGWRKKRAVFNLYLTLVISNS